MNTQDFLQTPVRKLFFHYLLPSIFGTMVTSLCLVDRCCISKLQLLGLFIRIIRKSSLFILHGHQFSIRIDLSDNAQVAVEHTHAALSDHSIDSSA